MRFGYPSRSPLRRGDNPDTRAMIGKLTPNGTVPRRDMLSRNIDMIRKK
jgi:hypothetical protein